MNHTGRNFTGTNGSYTLGNPIKDGRGGEGTVYRIKGKPALVAKIYHENVLAQSQTEFDGRHRKLLCMLRHSVRTTYRGKLRVAWPQDILYSKGRMVGYVMPRVKSAHGLYEVWMQDRQDAVFRRYSWRKSVHVAWSLAQAIADLHKCGVVLGDFNPKNFLVDRWGNVILVDTDSYDITDPKTGERFPCRVARGDMLAPELQGYRNLSTVRAPFTRETDYFSLALLIFRLLMGGFHPFGCVCVAGAVSSSADITEQTEIVNGNCAYVRDVPGRKISPQSPILGFLPADIRKLFIRTFHYTAHSAISNISRRASAEEWVQSLRKLHNSSFRKCRSNRRHVFPNHNRYCPFCGQKRKNPFGGILAAVILAAVLMPNVGILATASTQFEDTAKGFLADATFLVSQWISSASDFADSLFAPDGNGHAAAEQELPSTAEPVPPGEPDYVLPSDQRLLTHADVEGMTRQEIQLAINEIYARHGRYFSDSEYGVYFHSKSWYNPQKNLSDEEIEAMLSPIEAENLNFLVRCREKLT